MKPKTVNTLYWVFTILFSVLMLFSSWSSIVVNEDSVKLIHGMLGYPEYFIPFTGWAKLIGVIAILVPSFRRIKEWAYAGLFFDLVAATYSGIAIAKAFDPLMLTLLLWYVPGILSYVYWHKKLKLVSNRKGMAERGEAVVAFS
jgi:DoxX-like family